MVEICKMTTSVQKENVESSASELRAFIAQQRRKKSELSLYLEHNRRSPASSTSTLRQFIHRKSPDRIIFDIRIHQQVRTFRAYLKRNKTETPPPAVTPSSALKTETDKEIIVNAIVTGKNVVNQLKQKYPRVQKRVLAEAAWNFIKDNRKTIVTALAIPTIALVGSSVLTWYLGGLSTSWLIHAIGTVAGEFGPTILPGVIKDMFVGMGINLGTSTAMATIKAAMQKRTGSPTPALPKFVREKLAKLPIDPAIYMASMDMMMETLIREGSTVAYQGVHGYIIGKSLQLAPAAVTSVVSGTAKSLKSLCSGLRKVSSNTVEHLKSRWRSSSTTTTATTATTTSHSELLTEAIAVPEVKTSVIVEVSSKQLPAMKRPPTKRINIVPRNTVDTQKVAQKMITENRLMGMGMSIAGAIAQSYFTGNDIQSSRTLFGVLNEVVGLNNFLARVGHRLTADQLTKIKALHKKLGPTNQDNIIKKILREIYGQNHRQLDVAKLDREQLYLALYERNISVKPNEDLEFMRRKLSQVQQELQGLTYLALMESITKKLVTAGVSSATARALDVGYTSYKDAMKKAAEKTTLTPEQQGALNSAPDSVLQQPDLPRDVPTSVTDQPQQALDEAIHEIEITATSQETQTAQRQDRKTRIQAHKDAIKQRQAEREQAVRNAQDRANKRRLREALKTEDVIKILPTDDMLIPKEIADQLKQIEFTPLFRQAAGAMQRKIVNSGAYFIPGLGQLIAAVDTSIDIVNANIEAANRSLDLANLTVLGSKLFSPDSAFAKLQTVALGKHLPTIPQLDTLVNKMIGAEEFFNSKVDGYTVMLRALKRTLLDGGDTTDFMKNIAREVSGHESAYNEIRDKIFGAASS